MPRNLIRLQKSGQFHLITLSCHQRKPFLARAGGYAVFENEMETARQHYAFVIAFYVLMPEHVHLLISEPRLSSLSVALQVLKQETSTRLKHPEDTHFWLPRYYDFNVFSDAKWMEKLKYMHRNPVHGPASPLRDRRSKNGRNRVALDSAKRGTGRTKSVRSHPSQEREGRGTHFCNYRKRAYSPVEYFVCATVQFVSPTLNRANRLTAIFSPSLPIFEAIMSLIATDCSLMNG